MLRKNDIAKNAEVWCGLNRVDMDKTEADVAPPLAPSLASMYAGRKIIQKAWGYWADEIGKLEKSSALPFLQERDTGWEDT